MNQLIVKTEPMTSDNEDACGVSAVDTDVDVTKSPSSAPPLQSPSSSPTTTADRHGVPTAGDRSATFDDSRRKSSTSPSGGEKEKRSTTASADCSISRLELFVESLSDRRNQTPVLSCSRPPPQSSSSSFVTEPSRRRRCSPSQSATRQLSGLAAAASVTEFNSSYRLVTPSTSDEPIDLSAKSHEVRTSRARNSSCTRYSPSRVTSGKQQQQQQQPRLLVYNGGPSFEKYSQPAANVNSLACLERDFGDNSALLNRIGTLNSKPPGPGRRIVVSNGPQMTSSAKPVNSSTRTMASQQHQNQHRPAPRLQPVVANNRLHHHQLPVNPFLQQLYPPFNHSGALPGASHLQRQLGAFGISFPWLGAPPPPPSTNKQGAATAAAAPPLATTGGGVKCIECCAGFESFAALTLHMFHSGHYANIVQCSATTAAAAAAAAAATCRQHVGDDKLTEDRRDRRGAATTVVDDYSVTSTGSGGGTPKSATAAGVAAADDVEDGGGGKGRGVRRASNLSSDRSQSPCSSHDSTTTSPGQVVDDSKTTDDDELRVPDDDEDDEDNVNEQEEHVFDKSALARLLFSQLDPLFARSLLAYCNNAYGRSGGSNAVAGGGGALKHGGGRDLQERRRFRQSASETLTSSSNGTRSLSTPLVADRGRHSTTPMAHADVGRRTPVGVKRPSPPTSSSSSPASGVARAKREKLVTELTCDDDDDDDVIVDSGSGQKSVSSHGVGEDSLVMGGCRHQPESNEYASRFGKYCKLAREMSGRTI